LLRTSLVLEFGQQVQEYYGIFKVFVKILNCFHLKINQVVVDPSYENGLRFLIPHLLQILSAFRKPHNLFEGVNFNLRLLNFSHDLECNINNLLLAFLNINEIAFSHWHKLNIIAIMMGVGTLFLFQI